MKYAITTLEATVEALESQYATAIAEAARLGAHIRDVHKGLRLLKASQGEVHVTPSGHFSYTLTREVGPEPEQLDLFPSKASVYYGEQEGLSIKEGRFDYP